MSQKDGKQSADKWRDLAENENEATEEAGAALDDAAAAAGETPDTALRDKVNLLEKQVDMLKDQYARAQAEVDNTRRRMEQEVSKARKFGVERLISELIPVAESLVKGLEVATSSDPQVKLMREGNQLTLGIVEKLLEKNGVVSIDPAVGDPFDPTQHEAMAMQPDPEAASGTVLKVLQKGYALHGRVIRAAMVIVAA